jgi:DNA-binding response OmpR family regulator
MQRPCLLVYVNDTASQSQIENIAQAQNIDVHFAAYGDQLTQLAKTIAPFTIILDLTALDSEWLFRHISSIRGMKPDLPVVALIPELQEETRDRAEKYGCNRLLLKTEIERILPKLVGQFVLRSY